MAGDDLNQVNDVLDQVFGPGQLQARRILSQDDSTLLAEGVDGDTAVLIKIFLDDEAEGNARRLEEDLAQRALRLPDGQLATPRRRSGGLVVLDLPQGQGLDQALAGAAPEQRARLLTQAGAWLRDFTAGRRETGEHNFHLYVRGLKDQLAAQSLAPGDALHAGAMITALRAEARELSVLPPLLARVHGDFTPAALRLGPGDHPSLAGVFTGQLRHHPLALDAAAFLVTLTCDTQIGIGPRRYGLPRADVDAFLQGCPEAGDRALWFCVGARLLSAMIEATTRPDLLFRLRPALGAWMAEGESRP